LRLLGFELGVLFFESIGDVFKEDEPKHDVLVLGGVHAAAQRIGHLPKLGFVADVSAVVLLFVDRSSYRVPFPKTPKSRNFKTKSLIGGILRDTTAL
jgi:hypothetical protein